MIPSTQAFVKVTVNARKGPGAGWVWSVPNEPVSLPVSFARCIAGSLSSPSAGTNVHGMLSDPLASLIFYLQMGKG